ncbi:hypothetical protein [Janthinobacterium sp.]|uniref:hypothetical protein n=1 Tax=Janthinobacterium sp. TaxID=1871054 RepID=UPI0025C691EF|nr:hypothetical protein [Janthinobacterium sp.]NBV18758.1 hypothetical protein [Janthinobacterium sp.]
MPPEGRPVVLGQPPAFPGPAPLPVALLPLAAALLLPLAAALPLPLAPLPAPPFPLFAWLDIIASFAGKRRRATSVHLAHAQKRTTADQPAKRAQRTAQG